MGTVNSSFLPATTGLTLGNQNQQWTAYLSNIFGTTFQSNSSFPALSGILRLASGDSIGWRNNANSGDVLLGKTGIAAGNVPADTLTFSGGGIEGPFISNSLNPAATGEVRLSASDVVNFRNQANGADIAGLTHNSDDTVTVGGAAGIAASSITTAGNLTVSGNEALSGTLTSGAITAPSLAGASGVGVTVSSGGTVSGNGQPITVSGGNAGGGIIHNGGNVVLNGGTPTLTGLLGRLQSNTVFNVYNGIALQNDGIPSEVASILLTAQTAAITTTTLYAVPSATASALYRLSWSSKVTTVAGTSSTLGALTVVYTDPDGTVQTIVAGALSKAGAIETSDAGNLTSTVLLGLPILLNCKANTNITYAMAYASNAANVMAYNLNLILEAF